MTEYTTLALDENNDIRMDENGNLAIASGVDAVSDIAAGAVRTDRGELQLNLGGGIPYFTTVLGVGKPDAALWASYAVDALRGIDGVKSVDDFEYSVKGGILRYSAVIRTKKGGAVING